MLSHPQTLALDFRVTPQIYLWSSFSSRLLMVWRPIQVEHIPIYFRVQIPVAGMVVGFADPPRHRYKRTDEGGRMQYS